MQTLEHTAHENTPIKQVFAWLSQGITVQWVGGYPQAKQALIALKKRCKTPKPLQQAPNTPEQARQCFNQYRLAQAQQRQILNGLVIKLEGDYSLNLKKSPDIKEVCQFVYGSPTGQPRFIALRELLGMIGAYQWRLKGVPIHGLEQAIYPFYGVFSPIRGEYLQLVQQAPLPNPCKTALDVGTGTGVLSLLLAQKGVSNIDAIDSSEQAVRCAQFNIQTHNVQQQVQVFLQDYLPSKSYDLIICNPPWLPGKVNASLEAAVYDPKSQLLKLVLFNAQKHLNKHGQLWLIISDLAEHLGLRSRQELMSWIDEGGLQVHQRTSIQAHHKKTQNREDPLHWARIKEQTSLWILTVRH